MHYRHRMDTEALRWFQQVADGTTVTEVADIFGVSQPGVSRALDRLDKELGTPLLEKSGRVLRPTLAGATFKRHVDDLLHDLDDGLAAIDQLVDPETGSVSVAFQLSLGTWLIPHLVSQFRALHPGVTFSFAHSHDVVGSAQIASGMIDVQISSRRPRNPAMHWRRLLIEQLFLAVPADHALAHRDSARLADVAEDPFVMLGATWELRQLTESLCAAAGFAPKVAFEGDDVSMVTGFVGAGLGVAIVPSMGLAPSARPRGDGPVLVAISDPGAVRDIGMAWSRERRLLPSAALFREFVLSADLNGFSVAT